MARAQFRSKTRGKKIFRRELKSFYKRRFFFCSAACLLSSMQLKISVPMLRTNAAMLENKSNPMVIQYAAGVEFL
jgi:hypothetical protein